MTSLSASVGHNNDSPTNWDNALRGPKHEPFLSGLDSQQVVEILRSLYDAGQLDSVGTPSRDQALSRESSSGTAEVIGMILTSRSLANRFLEMLPALLQQVSSNPLFDIKKVTYTTNAGKQITAVQVYPSGDDATPIAEGVLLKVNQNLRDSKLDRAQAIFRELKHMDAPNDERSAEACPPEELRLRILQLIENKTVNMVALNNLEGKETVYIINDESRQTVTDAIARKLAENSPDAHRNYAMAVRTFEGVNGTSNTIRIAEVTPTSLPSTDPQRSLTALGSGQRAELGLENATLPKTIEFLTTLVEGGRLDTFQFKDANHSVFPYNFKEGGPVHVLTELATRFERDFHEGGRFDVFIMTGDCRCGPNSELLEQPGFHVILAKNS